MKEHLKEKHMQNMFRFVLEFLVIITIIIKMQKITKKKDKRTKKKHLIKELNGRIKVMN